MNVNYDKEITIYRFEGQYGPSYSIGLSKKTQDDKVEYGYFPCKFRKGVELSNKSKIKIRNAFISFNKKDNKTYPYIFINSFEELYQEKEEIKEEKKEEVKPDPYAEFSNEIEITDDQLPF